MIIHRSELREGNFIRCKIYNGNKDVIIPFSFNEAKYLHLCEPVPVTAGWLLSLGFESDIDGIYKMEIGRKSFALQIGDEGVGIDSFGVRANIGVRYAELNVVCQYVHQLQNIIYALAETELTYKPVL